MNRKTGSKSNNILFTHADLDATGCALVAKKVFGNLKIEYHNYESVDKSIEWMLDHDAFKSYDNVLIADISPNKDLSDKIDAMNPTNILLCDHHDTRDHVQKYSWAVYDEARCGAKILYEQLLSEGYNKVLTGLDEFIDLVDVYDTWNLKSSLRPKAEELNILHKFVGKAEFLRTSLKKADPADLSKSKWLINKLKGKRNWLIKVAVDNAQIYKDDDGRKYSVTFVEDYIGETGAACCKRLKVDYAVMFNLKYGAVGLRNEETSPVDISIIAEGHGGGGHEHSAAFNVDTVKFYKLADDLLRGGKK